MKEFNTGQKVWVIDGGKIVAGVIVSPRFLNSPRWSRVLKTGKRGHGCGTYGMANIWISPRTKKGKAELAKRVQFHDLESLISEVGRLKTTVQRIEDGLKIIVDQIKRYK